MKTLMTILLTSVTFFVTSQIKVFSGGLQSYGSTTSPAYGEKHHFAGDLVVSESGSTGSGCVLLRANGTSSVSSASRPDYTWLGDNNTGLFHPANDVIGLTINGTEKWRIHNNGQLLSNLSSAAATPDYSFYGDQNTGVFSAGADLLGFSTGGTERFRMNSSGQLLNANSTSSASTPDYSWNGDPNTGIFHPAADVFGIATNGTERARFSSSGNLQMGTTTVENARINIVTTDATGIYVKTTFNSDWGNPMVETETNRGNSATYRTALTGTGTTFYVAGAGWIFSQGNYLGSDRNIKDDIHTIDSAGSKLNRITGVTYTLKKEKQNPALYGNANEYMGVIAQDVEAVAPQAVKTLNDGTKAVCYEMLVGLLIEGFKEQSLKIEQLQNDLNRCCEKNDGKTERSIHSPSMDSDSNSEIDKTYLKQNNPNPFNKESVIEYNIIESGTASILVFDMNGKLLKTIPVKIPGKGSITISANDFEAGMYYYSLIVNDREMDTKKMILTQ